MRIVLIEWKFPEYKRRTLFTLNNDSLSDEEAKEYAIIKLEEKNGCPVDRLKLLITISEEI
jgi:hypothetical protein